MGQQHSTSTESSGNTTSVPSVDESQPKISSSMNQLASLHKPRRAGKHRPTAPSSAQSPRGAQVRIASVTKTTTVSPIPHKSQNSGSSFFPSSHTSGILPRRAQSASSTRMSEDVGLNDFHVLKLLGKGSHGKVYLVRHRGDGKLYAMKQLRKRHVIARNQVQNTMTEFMINAKLADNREDCPYVAKMHWAFATQSRLYMVFEYLSGGELFFHIARRGKLPEHLAKFYAAEVALSLAYLHKIGIVYRDLKPENLMLDSDGHIHLVDFGLCKDGVTSPVKGSNSFCGTTEYLAPEVLCNTGHGFAVDWWAFGMVLHEILTGLPPWYSNDKDSVVRGIMHGELVIPEYVSDDARSLIEALLVRDPHKRLGTNGSDEVLQHPFFKDLNWERLAARGISPGFAPPKDQLGSNFSPEFTSAAIEVERYPQPTPLYDRSDPFRGFKYPLRNSNHTKSHSVVGITQRINVMSVDECKHSDDDSVISRKDSVTSSYASTRSISSCNTSPPGSPVPRSMPQHRSSPGRPVTCKTEFCDVASNARVSTLNSGPLDLTRRSPTRNSTASDSSSASSVSDYNRQIAIERSTRCV